MIEYNQANIKKKYAIRCDNLSEEGTEIPSLGILIRLKIAIVIVNKIAK